MNSNNKHTDIVSINDMVLSGKEIPITDDIIQSYINIEDISLYRYYVENLKIKNSYLKDIIENRRKKKYDNIFSIVSSDGLLKEYQDIYDDIINGREINTSDISLVMGLCGTKEDIHAFLHDESSKKLRDILIDRYFEDIPDNFMANLEMVINFTNSISNNILPSDRLDLYRKIYNFNNLSTREKLSLYKSLNNDSNYVELFYLDYRNCKYYAYTMYNESIIKLQKMKKSNLSSAYGIDVYELSGENFKAIIHQTKIDRNGSLSDIWQDIQSDETTISLAMIDQNHFDTIYGYDSYITLGFSNLDVDRIMHVYHTDSFTNSQRGSDRVNEILTPSDLMNSTKGYNEILYLENNQTMENGNKNHSKLMPSYVLCYNYITNVEISISKKYKIPIVLLHTDKYENKVDPKIDYSNNVYLSYDSRKSRK